MVEPMLEVSDLAIEARQPSDSLLTLKSLTPTTVPELATRVVLTDASVIFWWLEVRLAMAGLAMAGIGTTGFVMTGFSITGFSITGFVITGFAMTCFGRSCFDVPGLEVSGLWRAGFPITGFVTSGLWGMGCLAEVQLARIPSY